MAKRKKRQQKTSSDAGKPLDDPVGEETSDLDDLKFEKARALAEMSRIIGEQDFSNPEEANQYLQEHFAGRTLSEIADTEEIQNNPHFQAIQLLEEHNWQDATDKQNEKVIEQALKIDPDCVDAWIWRANLTAIAEERQRFLEIAVETGRRNHAELITNSDAPYLWGHIEARPLLDAMLALAEFHFERVQAESARPLLEEILRWNPNDNQGARFVLCSLLILEEDYSALDHLFGSYPDDCSAEFEFGKALATFNRAITEANFFPDLESRNPFHKLKSPRFREANRLLKVALEARPWTAVFLLDGRSVMTESAPYIRMFHPSECLEYARLAYPQWTANFLPAVWLNIEINRWLQGPRVKKALETYHDDFYDLMDYLENFDIEDLFSGGKGDAAVEDTFEDLRHFASIADGLAEEMLRIGFPK